MWLSPSSAYRFLPPPWLLTNRAGTDRNAPPAIRTSRKADTLFPILRTDAGARALYRETVDLLFAEYRHFSEEMFRYLRDRTPKPDEMKLETYERTLRARAFDISRYLLPLATNTSLGQIVSARTLETQVSRLLSDPHAEVRRLGEMLKQAARDCFLQRGPQPAHTNWCRRSSVSVQRLPSEPVNFFCATSG